MVRQTVAGPYRVKPTDTGYELMELVNDKLIPLRPERTYEKEKRTSAYRAMALLNRKWQEKHQEVIN